MGINEANKDLISQYFFETQPNSFSEKLVINYGIPQTSDVEIVIYNIAGQQVKTIVKTRVEQGLYTTIWNGFDDNDRKLPNGVYFIRMNTEGRRMTNKVLMVK